MRVAVLAILVSSAWAQYLPMTFNTGGPPPLVAPTLVQVVGCGGVAGSITCTPAAIGGSGKNTVVVFGLGNSSTCSTATGTGYSFQRWQSVTQGGSDHQDVFVARSVTAGSTTVTLNCTGTNSGAVLYEWAPQSDSAHVNYVVAADAIGGSSGTNNSPTATTTNAVGVAAEAIIGTMYDNSSFRTLTAGSGYTMQQKVNDSSHSANCTTTCLIGSETANTTTGLSGTQTATMSGPAGGDNWNMSVLTLANTPAQDIADTIITFEGLQNTVVPTVPQLNASTFGIPCTWTSLSPTNMTGATAAQLGSFVNNHQIGATSYTGSGSLGLAYATGTAGIGYRCTFVSAVASVSFLMQFQTDLPTNCTNLNAYSLEEIENSGGNDFYMAQIQCNGSVIHLAHECGSGSGSQTYTISRNTKYYIQVNAVNNSGTSSLKLFDSTGAQIGTTSTCTAVASSNLFTRINFGVTGAESETAGSNIYVDNVLISYTGSPTP